MTIAQLQKIKEVGANDAKVNHLLFCERYQSSDIPTASTSTILRASKSFTKQEITYLSIICTHRFATDPLYYSHNNNFSNDLYISRGHSYKKGPRTPRFSTDPLMQQPLVQSESHLLFWIFSMLGWDEGAPELPYLGVLK